MVKAGIFDQEYKKLNKAQKEAVDSIEGPVMVVAGPGTGKTQILALRIGNILLKTDAKADAVLCLTFTNSAVRAMRERLRRYIGPEASKVRVSTFHSFGLDMLERYFLVLGLEEKPKLMDEKDTLALFDQVLENNDWQYIRPRADPSRYFRDLKNLISLLKRERLTAEDFESGIKKEIENIEKDPANLSSRGKGKGGLKKEMQKKIEGLHRTQEAIKFYGAYESAKKERNLFDYDDILEALVSIVEESPDAKNYIKENFLYVLIDEHQDSSGVQNEFLQKVWGEEEKPNIFVVGDDRQLIYGFGGASLEYFENFKNAFGKARLITLLENYRSTQKILDSAHSLLESSLTKDKLKSNLKGGHSLRLVEAYYPRDEIIFCGLEIKEKIKKGQEAGEMAILVPKNRQVRSAITILKDLGLPVSAGEMVNFFDLPEALAFIRVLKIIANPGDGIALAASFFDKNSLIFPFKAHEFIKNTDMRSFSLLNIKEEKNNLFKNYNEVNIWIQKLKTWLSYSVEPLYPLMQKVGTEFLLDTSKSHQELVARIEILRTLLHLALFETEKNPKLTLKEFLNFLERAENYGETMPLAVFSPADGIKVLTLHGSKGLEFDYVWIAHMDEKSFSGSRREGFVLPEFAKERVEKRDEMVLKRELYVAITRAKRFCAISYALKSHTGGDQELARIVADLESHLEKQNADETEKIILKSDKRAFVETHQKKEEPITLPGLVKLATEDYRDRKVSVSLLNNFFECPWKWYFRSLLQLPEPKEENLEFGNAVHASIDKILKMSKKPSQEEVKEIAKIEVLKRKYGDEKKQEQMRREIFEIVSKWVKNRLPQVKSDRENEKSVSAKDDKFPHLNIYGKIDLIEHLSKKELRVTDFKTGSVRKKSDVEKIDPEGRISGYLRQLAMYSYLIKQSSRGKLNVRESRLEFLEAKDPQEAFYDRVITSEEIDLLIKDISDYDHLVKSGEWLSRPCHYNAYGKNTECEYCKLAEIYK